MADSKKAHFSKSPILKIFSRKFLRFVLGLVGLNDAKGIDVAQCIWPWDRPTKAQKQPKKCIFGTFWLFLSFCRTASRPYTLSYINSRASNIAILLEWAQISDLDFGLIQQNISTKKASFQYQGCPLSFKSGKLWLNSYIFEIRIPIQINFIANSSHYPIPRLFCWFLFSGGDKKKKKRWLANPTEFFH